MPFLVAHPDPRVRGACGHLLAAWGEHDALLRLAGDPRYGVMQAAMHALGKTTPNAAAAQCARTCLAHPRVTGACAEETLATYVAHAPPAEAIPLLARLVADDPRQTVRRRAVHALIELHAARELAELLPLLEAPPRVHWGVHLALLEGCRKLGLDGSRGADMLREVDDIHVQGALARLT
ncbi:HEAT repeat domain-containing protein [Nannocystis pusilla]|uniref:HEAT repeat domain-containing protein n=1 Tax=Nannocystis pusilla TaxID=889268 RepID=A0ABS7TUJ9_9BACT|nr:HEAT repeat domain-containing protein [Nannocystis pusilla]MBZ5711927.1 hypothetical protein [Nannocystis pusilla]